MFDVQEFREMVAKGFQVENLFSDENGTVTICLRQEHTNEFCNFITSNVDVICQAIELYVVEYV